MVVKRDGQRVDLGTFALHSQTLEDGSTMVSLDFYVEPEAVTFQAWCAVPRRTPSPWPAWWWRL